MHPNIIFAKFQIHANVIPRRRNERKEQAEDVMRCGVIPMQFHFITYGMELYTNDSIPRNTNMSSVCVCERAERASLENFGIFTFLNYYLFQYFVVTFTGKSLVHHG